MNNHQFLQLLLVICSLFLNITPCLYAENSQQNILPVYYFWSNQLTSNFYTSDLEEKNWIEITFNEDVWKYMGIAFYVLETPTESPEVQPVYRFWSDHYQSHYFTINAEEKNWLISNFDTWTYEGIAWYAFINAPLNFNSVPILRYWSDLTSTHYFPMNYTENDETYEGIAWYAFSYVPVERIITQRITENDDESYRSDYFNPKISSDGSIAVYQGNITKIENDQNQTYSHIFVYSVTNSSQLNSTFDINPSGENDTLLKRNTNPAVNENGRYIALYSYDVDVISNLSNVTSGFIVIYDLKTGETQQLEIKWNGDRGYGGFYSKGNVINPVFSANGKLLAFEANTNEGLVSDDTNSLRDIFVYNIENNQVERVSLDSQGNQTIGYKYCVTGSSCVSEPPHGHSYDPDISSDGRWVSFTSEAKNLDNLNSEDCHDSCFQCTYCLFTRIYTHDRVTKQTELITRGMNGENANGSSFSSSINSDGQFIVFASDANNLVENDKNTFSDIFLYDRQAGKIEIITLGKHGVSSNGSSWNPRISQQGRYIVFVSQATNLTENALNSIQNIFRYDREQKRIELISLNSDGYPIQYLTDEPEISEDGKTIVFTSESEQPNSVRNIFLHHRSDEYSF
ncbi:MAG: PD40 domain-containing protein [Desulfobacterales bacterium]|nr:PD40 domain-containing protein [Desulfobacterales bacterium]